MQNWLELVELEFTHPAIVLWRAIEMKRIEELTQELMIEEPILDIGCAEGKIASIVFKGKKVFGLDNSWDLISQNKKRDQALVLADGRYISFKGACFSTVFSNCVIEHIRDLDKLLGEVSRVLKKGGVFIFTVPSDKFPKYLYLPFKRYGDFRMKWLNCFHCYSPQYWEKILAQNNLKMVTHSYYMSKKATQLWDLLAGIMFISRGLKINFLEKPLNSLLRRHFKKLYETDATDDGAGILVVAQRC